MVISDWSIEKRFKLLVRFRNQIGQKSIKLTQFFTKGGNQDGLG